MTAHAKQYTIRSVPAHVDSALRKKAAETGQSLNTILLRALEREAGVDVTPALHHDLDFLSGSWVSDPKVEEALNEQRRVDPEDWK